MTNEAAETAGGPGRRQMMGVAGALAAAGALSACSSSSNDGEGTTTNPPGDGGTAQTSAKPIAAADVPVGGGTVIEDAQVVVTQPTKGEFKAFSAVCTHAGCLVSQVKNGVIVCTCHGSTFDMATGAVKSGLASRPLPAKTVTVGADGLIVG